MRVQTTFEKIAQGTSQKLFAACFVALRIAFGAACLFFAFHLMQMATTAITSEPGSPLYYHELADQKFLTGMYAPVVAGVGLVFLLGILVRPVSALAMFIVLVNAATSGSINPQGVWLAHGLIALVLCLFAAGGSSHVIGLDGIISRNIRRPNAVTKFLFG